MVRPDLGIIKPRLGASFVLLSTGVAGAGLGGLGTPEPGTDFPPAGPDGDAVSLELDLVVPAHATRLSFQYNFLSTESPEFLQTIFNDTFSVRIVDAAGPHDFSLASVNSSDFFEASDSHAKGTGFDIYADQTAGVTSVFGGVFPDAGLTDFQGFSFDVTGGDTIQLIFSVQDNGDGILDSAVVLDALQFSSIATVDPNPDLLVGGVITQDPDTLATQGRVVRGAVADGTSEVLLRVKVPGPGNVTFAVPPPPGATAKLNGSLTAIDGAGPSDPNDLASPITTRAVAAAGGEYAFARFHAPPDFNRGSDAALLERAASVTASYTPDDGAGAPFDAQVNLQIRRPPVVLARGLWSNRLFWLPPTTAAHDENFIVNSPAFDVTYATQPYSCNNELRLVLPPDAVHSACPWQRIAPPDGTVLCKTEQETAIGAAAGQALFNVRKLGIAASKVDLVAHGDTGIQARRYIGSPGYQNDVNRLITVNTPHFGTRAVDALAVTRSTDAGAPSTEDFLCHARANAEVPIDAGDLDSLESQHIHLTHTSVPAHALVGTGAGALSSLVFKARAGALFGTYAEVKAKIAVSIGKVSPTGCAVFGTDDHDMLVETASQQGGIADVAHTAFAMTPAQVATPDQLSDYLHSTRNVNVSKRIVELLNSPVAGPLFAEFPDATTLAATCGLNPAPGLGREARSALAVASGTVRVTSPASGTEVLAGATVTVEIAAENGFVPASVLAVIRDSTALAGASPLVAHIQVPPEALGRVSLFVIGTDANDESVVSEAVTLNVRTDATLQTVKIVTQDPVLFGTGRQRALDVLGEYNDDVTRDITAAAVGTEYHSSNVSIATVSADGVVTSVSPGIATITARNGTVQDSISVTVLANRSPVARAGGDVSRACVFPGATTPVQLDGSASFDPEGDPLTYSWFEGGVLIASGPTPVVDLGPGDHAIELVVSDGSSSSPPDTVEVSLVADSEPPVVVIHRHRTVLWPPDHRYRTFRLSDCVTHVSDACDGELDIDEVGKITRVTSDERESERHGYPRHHDDETCRDIVITGDSSVKLRAERDVDGNGRVYTVFFDVVDSTGNVAASSCQIAVPRFFPFEPAVENSCHYCEGKDCGRCPGHDDACR